MILDDIIAAKKEAIERQKVKFTQEYLREKCERAAAIRDFTHAVSIKGGQNEIRIIAEVKKASPSKGVIRPVYYPYEVAKEYAVAGAAAISVLTEEKYFMGELEHLVAIKNQLKLPVLRKDFIIDPYQVYETRSAGADAILLIVAILDEARLVEFMEISKTLGMATLVEVHDEAELKIALNVGAKIIGINNRNLKTMEVNLETTLKLAADVPGDRILVSESGINSFEDILNLRDAGVEAFLIGETMLKEEYPGRKLKELRGIS